MFTESEQGLIEKFKVKDLAENAKYRLNPVELLFAELNDLVAGDTFLNSLFMQNNTAINTDMSLEEIAAIMGLDMAKIHVRLKYNFEYRGYPYLQLSELLFVDQDLSHLNLDFNNPGKTSIYISQYSRNPAIPVERFPEGLHRRIRYSSNWNMLRVACILEPCFGISLHKDGIFKRLYETIISGNHAFEMMGVAKDDYLGERQKTYILNGINSAPKEYVE
jgi:hypothetical protein